jgi:hypothetical protein
MRVRPAVLTVVTIVLLLAACSSAPISYFALTPQPADGAYACGLRKVNELGYTITNTNKDAGFITGDKQTSGMATRVLLGSEKHDQITVSVFDDAATHQRKVRVTTGQTEDKANSFGSSKSAKKPSDQGIADANAILTACSEGAITKQALLRYEGEGRAVLVATVQ